MLINCFKEALLDPDCFKSVSLSSIVLPNLWTVIKSSIRCVHGDEKAYPTAEICLTIEGRTYLMSLALVPSLHIPSFLEMMFPNF